MRGAIHHLDLTVKNPQASRAFYTAVLEFMGYRLIDDHERGYDFNLEGPQGFCSVGVMRASGAGANRQHDRYSPGLHHGRQPRRRRRDACPPS
jgi:glyoxylase I family protein